MSLERITTTAGGALLTVAGLLLLVRGIGRDDAPALALLAAIALAVGAVVLALGPGGIAGGSWIGRAALVVLGGGPLVFALPDTTEQPLAIVLGTTQLGLITVATVVGAVVVAGAGVLHGVARWSLVPLAAFAVLVAVMSTVPLGELPIRFVEWRLELLQPLALLAAGFAIGLHGHGPAIRRRTGRARDEWRRSTDVGGIDREPVPLPAAER